MARGVNCLVLDEPTNHLDLPAIEQLEQALETYDGTLLLVTHDRRLLDAVRSDAHDRADCTPDELARITGHSWPVIRARTGRGRASGRDAQLAAPGTSR